MDPQAPCDRDRAVVSLCNYRRQAGMNLGVPSAAPTSNSEALHHLWATCDKGHTVGGPQLLLSWGLGWGWAAQHSKHPILGLGNALFLFQTAKLGHQPDLRQNLGALACMLTGACSPQEEPLMPAHTAAQPLLPATSGYGTPFTTHRSTGIQRSELRKCLFLPLHRVLGPSLCPLPENPGDGGGAKK